MSKNTRTRFARATLLAVAASAVLSGGVLLPQAAHAVPAKPGIDAPDSSRYKQEARYPTPLATTDAGSMQAAATAVTRQEIIARAKHWVDVGVEYDNYTSFEGYRKDCSGFVSMAWKLGTSATTRTLDNYATTITKEQLLPGDALLWVNPDPNQMGHVRIFGGWLDGAKSRFWVYEQTPPRAVYREYSWSTSVANGYRPIRADNVVEEANPLGTMLHEVRRADGTWTGFEPLGGAGKDIATTVMPDGSAQVVAIGADDVVYHRVRRQDGSWTPWEPLNGADTLTPAKGKKVAIAGAADGTAQVVIVGWDGATYHRVRKYDGSWTPFEPLGANGKDVAIAMLPDGSSQTVIIGADDVVYHRIRNAAGSWTPFAPLNGVGTTAPAKGKKVGIAGGPDGSAQVVIVGWDNGTYHRARFVNGDWSPFSSLGMAANDIAIATLSDNSSQVVAAGTDNVIKHRVRGDNGSWTPFAPLDGFGAAAMGKSVTIAGGPDGTAQVAITSF